MFSLPNNFIGFFSVDFLVNIMSILFHHFLSASQASTINLPIFLPSFFPFFLYRPLPPLSLSLSQPLFLSSRFFLHHQRKLVLKSRMSSELTGTCFPWLHEILTSNMCLLASTCNVYNMHTFPRPLATDLPSYHAWRNVSTSTDTMPADKPLTGHRCSCAIYGLPCASLSCFHVHLV